MCAAVLHFRWHLLYKAVWHFYTADMRPLNWQLRDKFCLFMKDARVSECRQETSAWHAWNQCFHTKGYGFPTATVLHCVCLSVCLLCACLFCVCVCVCFGGKMWRLSRKKRLRDGCWSWPESLRTNTPTVNTHSVHSGFFSPSQQHTEHTDAGRCLYATHTHTNVLIPSRIQNTPTHARVEQQLSDQRHVTESELWAVCRTAAAF